MLKKFLSISALCITFAIAGVPQAIADMINNEAKNGIPSDKLGILIINKNTGKVLASLNPQKPMLPASVAKIATTYAALLEFGADFKWPTYFYYTGRVKKGVLKGDLIVKAYGDPTLNVQDVKDFARKIRTFGIKRITGNLVLDRTFFKNSPRISSGFDKNYVSEYNAMPDALMYNNHLSSIKIIPTPNGIKAERLYGDRGFRLENHIRVVNGACRGRNSWPAIKFIKQNGSVAVSLGGTISAKCRPFTISKVLSRPYISFYYSFVYYLKQAGVEFNGNLVLKPTPKSAKLLFAHYSKPLLQIVAKTLKESNNLYARHIFLILGARRYGYPATIEKSQRAIHDILGSRGLIDSDDKIINGCGLSRESRLKPISAARILDDAYKTFGNKWLGALSIAGVDGTINKRFKHTIVKNHAFMKTGTLKRAKNIAGFVQSNSGNLYNTVIFYNGGRIWLGRDLQNKIITWLVRQ